MLLTLAIFLPLLGAGVIMLLPKDKAPLIRWTAFAFAVVTFIPIVLLTMGYADEGAPDSVREVFDERIEAIIGEADAGAQADFRELEYKMAGVQAEIVTPIAAASHLEHKLKDVEALWTELKVHISDNEDMKKFEEGFQGFKGMSGALKQAYTNEDDIEDLYDEWLDYKPLMLKSIDKLADEKKNYASTVTLNLDAGTPLIK